MIAAHPGPPSSPGMEIPVLTRFLAAKVEIVYAALRITVGLLFAFHGVQKLFGVMTDHQAEFGSQLWIGGVIELVTGIAVALGAYTTWAAFLASGTMAVAYVQFHWQFGLGSQLLPRINGGELALVYCLVFLYIACRGSGAFSVDRSRRA